MVREFLVDLLVKHYLSMYMNLDFATSSSCLCWCLFMYVWSLRISL